MNHVVQVAEIPIGSILRVVSGGSTMFVQLIQTNGARLFVDVHSEPVDFSDWEYATRLETETFRTTRRAELFADEVDKNGAPAFVARIRWFPGIDRDVLLRRIAAALTARGKSGKASQVLSYLTQD